MAKRKKPAANDSPRDAVLGASDVILLALVDGSDGPALSAIAKAHGMPDDLAATTIEQCRSRLIAAASSNRGAQLGASIARALDIYRKAMEKKDFKNAIAATKEHAKLLGLHQPTAQLVNPDPAADADDEPVNEQLTAVAAHVLPLKVCPESFPLSEHVRVLVEHYLATHEPGKPHTKPRSKARGKANG